MFRLVAILFSSLWFSGCFVLEEIRKGDVLIEQHSVGWRDKKKGMREAEEESAKAEAEAQRHQVQNTGPGVKDKLSDWWHKTVDEEPVMVNRNDKLVSCTLQGKVQFLRKSDCQLRQGGITELESTSESKGIAWCSMCA